MLGQSDGKVGAATKAEKSEAWGAKRLKFDPWFVRFMAVLKCTAMKPTGNSRERVDTSLSLMP